MTWYCRDCKAEYKPRDGALVVAGKFVFQACPKCGSHEVGTVKFKDPSPSVSLYGEPGFEGFD